MPLRDHFRPPVWNQASWEGFHGGWPMMMVLNLAPKLPRGYVAEPRVHLGSYFEIDVCTFEKDGDRAWRSDPVPVPVTSGGVATATLAPPAPTLTVGVDFPDHYVYEVPDLRLKLATRKLVGDPWRSLAPPNKDRAESRQLFIAKCIKLAAKRRLRLSRRSCYRTPI